MKLNYTITGNGPIVFILHGLLGMSDNWMSIAKELSKQYTIVNIDLRNHGASPHSDIMDYYAMSDDLLEIINDNTYSNISIVGHSMGGKVGMIFTDRYSSIVNNLIIIDICHRSYEHIEKYKKLFDVIGELDLNNFKSRQEIETYLKFIFPKDRTISLLQKNIKRNSDNTFAWKFNYKAIRDNLRTLGTATIPTSPIRTKTLFVKGGLSDYITQADEKEIEMYFQNVSIQTIPNASHWVNADQPVQLIQTIKDFIKTNTQ